MLEVVLFLTFLALTLFAWTSSSKHKYFSTRGVPQTRPKFLYGDYKDVVNSKMHYGLRNKEIYDAHKHLQYVGFYMLNTPAVLVIDPELVKNVLIKDFSYFANNNFQINPHDQFLYYYIFAARDKIWKDCRNIITPTITPNKLKSMFGVMENIVGNLINFIKSNCENADISLGEISNAYTIDVIAASTFGAQLNSFKDKESTFWQFTKITLLPSFYTSFKNVLTLVYPALGRYLYSKFVSDDIYNAVLKMTQEAIESKQKDFEGKYDLVSQLLAIRDKHPEKEITDVLIASQIWSFFVDGYETSSSVIIYCLFELGQNLDVQKRLQEEVDTHFDANNGRVSYNELMSLNYLDMVLSETMRMHPGTLAMERVCTKPYTLPPACEGAKPFHLEPGTPVVISTYGLHLDESYFPEPLKFNPDNFTSEAIGARPNYTFLPMGEGPRICLGSRLGLAMVKLAIASIVRNFEVRTPLSTAQNGYKLDSKKFVKKPCRDLSVKFVKRI